MPLVKLKNVYLDYPILSGDSRSFKKTFLNKFNKEKFSKDINQVIHIQALKNINLTIKNGDKIGLFGANGSGKTTLLKVIAKIFIPTRGSVYSEGKINSLIEMNSGLNDFLTGIENIKFRLSFFNLNKYEIIKKIEDIKNFSELDEFLYLPVKTYSAGMKMRLAFSIIVSLESDIILMDEWLSVGDQAFQEKAEIRLKSILEKAKILVLTSQNLQRLEKNCNKIIELKSGEIIN
jgi:lipopolysaccharide transport system ATP-binding protein